MRRCLRGDMLAIIIKSMLRMDGQTDRQRHHTSHSIYRASMASRTKKLLRASPRQVFAYAENSSRSLIKMNAWEKKSNSRRKLTRFLRRDPMPARYMLRPSVSRVTCRSFIKTAGMIELVLGIKSITRLPYNVIKEFGFVQK